MSKKEKLIDRLMKKPKDFTFDEMVLLLSYFGYELKQGGTGSGVKFIKEGSNEVINFHKPHPNGVLKKYHQTQAVHTNKELVYLKSKFPQNIKLFLAMKEEEIVAGTLIFEYEDCVHTQYMSANEIAREVGALDLLIYDLIEKYSQNKLYFDFGISTEKDGQLLNEGLIFQKEGFGGRTQCSRRSD